MSDNPNTHNNRRHCRRRGCLCTHTHPCDVGWIEMEPRQHNGQSYERVAPCPQCRPEAADRLAASIVRSSRDVNR